MTSFSDWESAYSLGSTIIKFHPQAEALKEALGTCPGTVSKPIYPTRSRRGSRWLVAEQMRRVGSYDDRKLLELLSDFAMLGGTIPTAGWENSLSYGRRISRFTSNYGDYLKAAYLLPPSWYLCDRIQPKSWLDLLQRAGVLGGGVLPTGRGHRCIAKDGHECNSIAEMEIDNWLHANGIPHEKEPLYPPHPALNPRARLRADFNFKVGDLLIEYAGLMDDPDYSRRMEAKKTLASEFGVKLLVITPTDLDNLDTLLEGVADARNPRNARRA